MYRRVRKYNWPALIAIFFLFLFILKNSEYDKSNDIMRNIDLNLVDIKLRDSQQKKDIEGNNLTHFMSNVFESRRKRIRDGCILDSHGQVQKILIYRPSNISYCVIPKAGCTYWKQIFRFLNGDVGSKNISSPFEINRMLAHYGSYKQMGNISFKSVSDRYDLSSTRRILVARNPYSRLWAVYLDKFLLPDFWRSHGKAIAKQKMRALNSSLSISSDESEPLCANNISFEDFIRYVVNIESRGSGSNEHWIPISKQCNPCLYRPDFIITMETFARDSKFILQHVGLDHLLKYHPKSRVLDELKMLINYNFQLLGGKISKCINALELCKRLWKVFQINGYISAETPFPEIFELKPSSLNKQHFMSSIVKAVDKNQNSAADQKQQKLVAMETAYQMLPKSLLRMIPYIYENDFRLFGYDPYPYNLFKDYKLYHYLKN
ncbi:hypothetical protein LOTGIDRAFT_162235 [Lottia gigantea]|uniref:Carbohydrate sulfotransferase n=1 Tax=Lottia gigantea TaxID=225164 RepID=V4ACC5_LOTGI|nr:hypothetical protein LOTGIDRAFT_162235 [Lottia gigantea]ESO92755.1 hypothetical protein LOTGIDRAFT_162235 [Lottia gigantea]